MNLQHSLVSSSVARLVGAVQRLKHPAPEAQASEFDAAMAAYTSQHYGQAFKALARLADSGHGPAARMALLMVAHGTRLHGHHFEADAAARRRWGQFASQPEQRP